jgi:tetratricopeptide (TPR) repeat protein
MIVKNEERNLSRCLESIRDLHDELVIVDTGSTDRTIEIARRFGAKVVEVKWKDDFSHPRNISLDNATKCWVLWLDADDEVPQHSVKSIKRIKNEVYNLQVGLGFTVKNTDRSFIGEEFFQLRMFPNDRRIRFEKRVHEQVAYSMRRIGYQFHYSPEIVINHTGYKDADKKDRAKRNRRILEEEIPRFPNDPNYLSAYGDTFAMEGNWEQAIAIYKIVREIPNCKNIQGDIYEHMYSVIATCYQNVGKYSEALHWAEKGLASSFSQQINLLYLCGEMCFKMKRYEKAIEYYKRAYLTPIVQATTPSDPKALKVRSAVYIGKSYYELGQHDEAFQWIDKVIKEHKNFADVCGDAGVMMLRCGNTASAFKYFSESVLRFPGLDKRSYLNIARISRDLGRMDDALRFARLGVDFFPDDEETCILLKTIEKRTENVPSYNG